MSLKEGTSTTLGVRLAFTYAPNLVCAVEHPCLLEECRRCAGTVYRYKFVKGTGGATAKDGTRRE